MIQQSKIVPGRPGGSLRTMRVSQAVAAVACSSRWLSQQVASFREGLVARGSVIRYARGQKIVGLEERHVSLHFFLEGAVQVSAPRADGEVVPVHVISPLEWFAEAFASYPHSAGS